MRAAVMMATGFLVAGCETTSWDASTPVQCRVSRAEVEVSCAIAPDGAVNDCRVARETAPGCGFAETALETAGRSRVTRAAGQPSTDSRVSYRIRFRNP